MAGRHSAGFPFIVGKAIRKEKDNLTGGPTARAVMNEQIRQNHRDSIHPGGADSAPPSPKAWYDKP